MTRRPTQPVVLTCPKCRQSVVLHVPASASCIRCAREMQPLTPTAARKPVRA